MIWKTVSFLLLICTATMGYFLYQNQNQTPQAVQALQIQASTQISTNGLTKALLVTDLKQSMMQLMDSNRKIEQNFSAINDNLKWYQTHVSPLIEEHSDTVLTTAKFASYLPAGIGKISDNVRIITALGKNISYYSNLVGSAEREGSALHRHIEQFILEGDTQKLPLIQKEIKIYRTQTEMSLEHLEKILPTLNIAKKLLSHTEGISGEITESITAMFFDKPKDTQKTEADKSTNEYKIQIDNIHQEINVVNTALKKGYGLADEIKTYIFILNKYQPILETES